MKFTDRLNARLHPFFAWRVREHYRRELRNWEKMHPESFGDVSLELKGKYVKLWSRLIPNPYDGWLRLLTNLSGMMDYRFVPADAYYAVIERCLNNCDVAGSGIDDKNMIYNLVPRKFLPKPYLRYSRGVWFDGEMSPISRKAADAIASTINFDVVGKIATDSCGGHGVRCYHSGEINLDWIEKLCQSYIIQEKVSQEPVAKSVNPSSVNTCRLVTFRRPWSGETSVIASMFRAGCSDAIVDNISSGGCCVDVSENGQLADVGVDGDFGRLSAHVGTGIRFADVRLPYFREMCDAAVEVARKVLDYNIMGFDVMTRPDGVPCIIEVNTTSIASIMIQMAHPLFKDETERVVEWSESNRRFDSFRHIRTFY